MPDAHTEVLVTRKPVDRRRLLYGALVVFAVLVAVYQANFTWLLEGDTVPTENLPVALLEDGRLSFEPVRFPAMFRWKGHAPFVETELVDVERWSEVFGTKTAREWFESKHLEVGQPRYFVVEATKREAYVSVFGPIPGLLLVPLLAPVRAFHRQLLMVPEFRALVSKTLASALVALTAVLLFAVAAHRTSLRRAAVIAAVYGLATCAWSVSSQNLWQQTVDQSFLMAGAYFVLQGKRAERARGAAGEAVASASRWGQGPREWRALVAAGFFLGAAVACRITAAFALLAVVVSIGLQDRRNALVLLLGSLPVPLLVGAYNAHYFGSPLTFAQELVGHAIAKQKTGSPDLFQTPFWEGALGLLLSPARGLAVYSPVLLPSALGLIRAFRQPRFHELRPFGVAALLMMATQCKWFDWWGGHTYGYRPWLDAVPFLTLCLVPVLAEMVTTSLRRTLFGAAFAWSVFVQALGAYSYDRSWNSRELHIVELPGAAGPVALYSRGAARRFAADRSGQYVGHLACDIDRPECRYRLWSIFDTPIVYYFLHRAETHAARSTASLRELTELSDATVQ